MMTEWMVISLGYYGLSLGVGQLGPNLYLTSLLSGLVEVPAYLLTNGLIDFFGRRNSLMLQLVLSGACCMAAAFSTSNTRTAVSLIGKFGVAGAFNILFLFTTELFPTSVRTAALGGCSQAARLGSIVAPPVLALKSVHPLLIIGIGILLAGTITLAFPEPLGAPPPESLETAEAARIPHPLERPSAQSTTSIEEGEKAYGKRPSDPSLRYEQDEDIANEQARQHQRLLEQVERTNTTDPSSE
jgi:MFS family permease